MHVNNPQEPLKVHNRPYPLKKCCTFRAKSIEKRKSFLRENAICYKCCTSTSPLAKDCKLTVKCSECESNRQSCTLAHLVKCLRILPHNWSTEQKEMTMNCQHPQWRHTLGLVHAYAKSFSQKFHQHQTSHSCIKWPSVSIHLDSSNAAYSEGSSLASNRGIWWQESSSRETREMDQDVRCVFGDPIPSGQPRCITVN